MIVRGWMENASSIAAMQIENKQQEKCIRKFRRVTDECPGTVLSSCHHHAAIMSTCQQQFVRASSREEYQFRKRVNSWVKHFGGRKPAVGRARFLSHKKQKMKRSEQRCANVSKLGVTLRLCRFAIGFVKTHCQTFAQESISDVATLLASRVAAGSC